MSELAEAAKITVFCLLAAIFYGILHDQVTAHLCVEYFSIAHPPIFHTNSPFLLAIGWGILATWWVGLPLGLCLAIAARLGPWPRMTLRQLRPLIHRLLLVMAISAILAGSIAALLTSMKAIKAPFGWDQVIPAEKWVAFTADAWAHSASYLMGTAGGLCLIWLVLWHRWHARPTGKP